MNHYRQEQLNASLLFLMAVLAILISNSAWQSAYQFMLNISSYDELERWCARGTFIFKNPRD
jgi:hypothetical protein